MLLRDRTVKRVVFSKLIWQRTNGGKLNIAVWFLNGNKWAKCQSLDRFPVKLISKGSVTINRKTITVWHGGMQERKHYCVASPHT